MVKYTILTVFDSKSNHICFPFVKQLVELLLYLFEISRSVLDISNCTSATCADYVLTAA